MESKIPDVEENPSRFYNSEKPTGSDSYASSDSQPDWTEEEEKKLVRKIDLILMPLLILPFIALQLDRGNMGNAVTDNFMEDVGINQAQYNVGQQLLSAGIVVLEIPSNLVLYRLGPQIWISFQIFAWGLVALFQAFQKGLGAYLATRLLLGLMEAGFIPASLYAITTWYKTKEMSVRFAIFFFGNYVAQAASGLIAYGVLHMRGVAGLTGWQWLFIIEGLYTVLAGAIYMAFYPKSRDDPVPFTRITYFNERERHIIAQRVILDDPSKVTGARKTISMKELRWALSDWTLYPHCLLTICALAPSSTYSGYGPKQIISFGYEKLQSNALYSIGLWIQLFTSLGFSFWADKLKKRGIPVGTALALWWGFNLGALVVRYSDNHGKRLAMMIMALAFSNIWHPLNSSWLAINARSPADRSIKMACIVMAANCAGIVGSQIFQPYDSPTYTVGRTVNVILISVALFFCLVQNGAYRVLNLLNKKKIKAGKAEEHEVRKYML
ncbi:putative alternative sulfate transporter protein [Lasiodiplodia theobromae]|uniref:Putative transporter n=1 Tax=Lasiodiplodia theobromae TaxID=45133 RepID=A0A5N5DPL1_9PEZI|nr:Alternative sulfate transporter [Lasiodiplodia theobromae]KAB2579281.1 putative transporter [Lasiodiplodia theobromae]KAF4537446.1 Alternative sulfate transporter [Lasiodiplodia theobromae]KAF9639585.1 putative alternative sulfate transporter protein [Lasiodiplodia theobromae]